MQNGSSFFPRPFSFSANTSDSQPDLIHLHEWQTGLIPAYLRSIYRADPFFSGTATVFTIHNIAYQGLFRKEKFALTGLPPEMYNPEGIEFWERINLMKAGIVYADVINTVSKKYSEEIQTPEFGYGLDGILRKRKEDLYGILNGVDYQDWDPAHDPHLIAHYGVEDLSGKKECKKDLLKEFGLPSSLEKAPLLGMISRLADQKGFDLLAEILEDLFALDIGFVLLGTGEQKYHDLFNQVARKYPERPGSGSPTMTGWPTRSRPAPTFSSCHRNMSRADSIRSTA